MQLHYNILWIDDEIKKFEDVGDLSRIIEYLQDLGFTPFLLPLKDGKEIENIFKDNKFDLIISDFSIEEGHHGDDIIKAIRKLNIFTEVLFYTSQPNELEKIAQKLLTIDRISFHSGRRDLLDKIETLISLSVTKLLELNATRGLITAETSELDVIVEQIVMSLVYDKLQLTTTQIDEIIQFYIDDHLVKSPGIFLQAYKDKGFKKGFYKIESNRKWNIFRGLLKKMPSTEIKEFLELNKKYGEDVISIRNKFAHSKAIQKDGKLFLAGFGPDGTPFEFDERECISIRKKLIDHRANFTKLSKYLGISIE